VDTSIQQDTSRPDTTRQEVLSIGFVAVEPEALPAGIVRVGA
jgi:hypothetical protein